MQDYIAETEKSIIDVRLTYICITPEVFTIENVCLTTEEILKIHTITDSTHWWSVAYPNGIQDGRKLNDVVYKLISDSFKNL